MVDSLYLDSLEIRGYRALRKLRIERLARVNLVVGKNNVGKTSLLEALWLYAYRGSPQVIWSILESREEGARRKGLFTSEAQDSTDRSLSVRNLLSGRADLMAELEPITIGPANGGTSSLSMAFGWWALQNVGSPMKSERRLIGPEDYSATENRWLGVTNKFGDQREVVHWLDRVDLVQHRLQSVPEGGSAPCVFVSANGLDISRIGQLWDSIALTNLEEDVLKSLKLIAPDTEGVRLVLGPYRSEGQRVPIVKLAGTPEPVPLRSIGEGMNRLFGVALALANSNQGLLLIDEVESGIHYSVLPQLWRLIFETAHRLNVQVFATTHSWDCIEAFQRAAEEDKHEEGLLVRLERRKGEMVATEFDERRLGIATREEIEVR